MSARLIHQQEQDRIRRNEANRAHWYVRTFGPEVGATLAAEQQRRDNDEHTRRQHHEQA